MATPSEREWKEASRKANSVTNVNLVTEAGQQQFEAKSRYNRGLLTPLEYANQCSVIWLSCAEQIQKSR